MAYQFIPNRDDKRIAVKVKNPDSPRGLAFIMHGLGGFQDQPQILAFAETFYKAGYTAVTFDARNTIGESEGSYEAATATSYIEDLEDVIAWAAKQPWYKEPFILAGHSLGGFCTLYFTEHHPEKVQAIAPLSTAISGKLSREAWGKEEVREWEKTGWRTKISNAKPGVLLRLPWSFAEDFAQYDVLAKAHLLTLPVLLIVGKEDTSTPPTHQQLLYDALAGQKEMHIITNSPHTFRDPYIIEEVCSLLSGWLKSLK